MLLPACEDNAKPSDAHQGDVCIGGRDLAGVDACAMELTLRCLVLDLADRFGPKSWNRHYERLLSVFGLRAFALVAADAL
jgi:hypothetical protein